MRKEGGKRDEDSGWSLPLRDLLTGEGNKGGSSRGRLALSEGCPERKGRKGEREGGRELEEEREEGRGARRQIDFWTSCCVIVTS